MRTSVLLATMLLAKELLQLHETGVVLDFKEEWSRAPARFHQSYSWLVCHLRNVPSKIKASYCGHAVIAQNCLLRSCSRVKCALQGLQLTEDDIAFSA